MRVLMIRTPGGVTGGSVHVDELSKGLRKRGHEVRVVRRNETVLSPAYYLAKCGGNYDILHLHGLTEMSPIASLAVSKKLFGCASVFTVHSFGPPYWYPRRPVLWYWRRPAMRKALESYDTGIVVSDFLRRRVASFTPQGPGLVTIRNGVDTDMFKPSGVTSSMKSAMGLEDKVTILFAGLLREEKGLPYLVEALGGVAREHENVRLLVIGTGILLGPIKKQVEEMHLANHVRFLGMINHGELPAFYAMSDMVIIPSTYESMPLVLLEAMSSGRPVVASRVGGIPEVVKDGVNGILVTPGESKDIERAILHLVNHPDIGVKLGRNARLSVEEDYTWDRVVKLTEQIYASIT